MQTPDSRTAASPVALSVATDAVDASALTKGSALARFASERGLDLAQVAAIGDSTTDLTFMEVPGLALAGAPANAQPRVIDAVRRMRNGVALKGEVLDGFEEFYEMCASRGVKLVVSDKDGVLVAHASVAPSPRLQRLFASMGSTGRPAIVVLTGASEANNRAFLDGSGVAAVLAANAWARRVGAVLLAENGTVHIDPAGPSAVVRWDWVDQPTTRLLQGPFRQQLRLRLESDVLPSLGMRVSDDHSDQASKVFMPPKRTMVTCNIPRSHGRIEDFRRHPASDELRDRVLEAMVWTARVVGLPYRVV